MSLARYQLRKRLFDLNGYKQHFKSNWNCGAVVAYSRAVSHDILDFSARVLATDCVELPNGPTGPLFLKYVGRISRHELFSGLAAHGRTLTERTTLDGDLSRSASLDRQQSLTKCKDFEASCLTHLHALTRSGPPDLRQFGARLRDRGCINFSEFGRSRTR
jgi:hypothetical protein